MRRFFFLLAVLVTGCDTIVGNEGASYMDGLDGDWTRTITSERVAANGAVTSIPGSAVGPYRIAREVECNRLVLTSQGKNDRVTLIHDASNPTAIRDCGVIAVDNTAERIILVGTAEDVSGMIRESSSRRHVWAFHTVEPNGVIRRTFWTLTR